MLFSPFDIEIQLTLHKYKKREKEHSILQDCFIICDRKILFGAEGEFAQYEKGQKTTLIVFHLEDCAKKRRIQCY